MENTNKPSSTSLLVGSHTSKPFAKWWAFPKMGPLIAEWAILYRQLCHGIVRNHGLPKLSYCHDMSWVQICSTDPLFKDRSDREWIVSWKTCPYIRELQCNTAIDFAVIPCYTLGFCQKKHPIFIAAPDRGWSSQCRWSSAYQLRFDLSIRAWLGKMMRDRPSHFWGYQGRRKCTRAILMHGLRHKYRTQVVPKFIRPNRTSRCNFRRSRLKTVDPVDMILLADHLIIRNGAVFRLRSRCEPAPRLM